MSEEMHPIILDVGKRTRRTIKAFKRGRGQLMDEVEEVLREVRAQLGSAAEHVELVPLIMLFKRKLPRRRRTGFAGLLAKT